MSDLDSLEQLARLFEQGGLTQQEFEAAKRRLLAAEVVPTAPAPGTEFVPGAAASAKARSPLPILVLSALGAVFLVWFAPALRTLISQTAGSPQSADPAETKFADVADDEDEWLFTNRIDKMTDQSVQTATKKLSAPPYRAIISISCVDDEALHYHLYTFNANGTPYPMKSKSNYNDYFKALVTGVQFRYRLDQGKPQFAAVLSSLVALEIQLDGSGLSEARADKLAKSRHVILEVPFVDGTGVFDIDQSGTSIRPFLDRCHSNPPPVPPPAKPIADPATVPPSPSPQPVEVDGVKPAGDAAAEASEAAQRMR